MTVVAARLLVSGAVQGVGYRAWTTRAARALGLCGFVRNLDDGRVEIVAQGTASALDSLVSQCGHGPPSARVDDVARTPLAVRPTTAFVQLADAAAPEEP